MHRKMLNNDKGFTLIELLVALTLLVILTGALYGTYFSVVSAREKGGARIEQRRELSTTLGKLHGELASAFFNKKNKRLHLVVEDRDSFGKPASLLEFTAIASPRIDPAPASDLTLLRYSVQEREGVLTLMRESRDPYLSPSVKSVPYPVMDVIEGFLVECYDGGKWVKSWDTAPELNRMLPERVRVTITMKGGQLFSTIASPRARSVQ
ncbi:MAG: general secretion pathway protein GspJ [Geobacteraceae bacterium GWC2_58_44]|nr:MAG: general secretion pathway protein GspJ [Geobacteraceae bacterium GWC2_58_44]HBG05873.1 general secretion pathway protein GspJ [Geobacter sp.]